MTDVMRLEDVMALRGAQLTAELEALDMARLHHRAEALELVAAAQRADKAARASLDDAVAEARALGATWQQIGDAAGMTRQSAWRRWELGESDE